MYSLEKTNLDYSNERPLVMGQLVKREGQALVAVMVDGKEQLKVSTGAAGEVLVGFASATRLFVDRKMVLKSFAVPAEAPFVVDTGVTNIEDKQIKIAGLERVATVGAVAAGKYHCAFLTGILTFHADDAELAFDMMAKKILTADEARALYHEGNINNTKHFELGGAIGCMSGKGEIYLDTFDFEADFSTGVIKLGADGVLTSTGSGTDVSGALRVISLPTVDFPFLGLAVNL